jgi:hypothetical protein
VSTEFSAFAPPSLDVPPAIPPAPAQAIGVPTLPSAAPATEQRSFLEAPLSSSPLLFDEPEEPECPSRSLGLTAGLVAIVVGAGALVAYGFATMPPGDAGDPAAPLVTQAAASPLIIPIEDARSVVADVNDNAAEVELLDELGLDPAGNPRSSVDQPATLTDIVANIEPIAAVTTTSFDDGTSFVLISIDDKEFADAMPVVRTAWLTQMGVPNSDVVLEDGSLITASADVAADGETITSLTVTVGSWTATYQPGSSAFPRHEIAINFIE